MPPRLVEFADHYWNEYLEKIAAAVAPLSEGQVWWRAGAGSNSIGNLLLHLNGNLSQWVLAGLGGESFERHRSEEFAAGADGIAGAGAGAGAPLPTKEAMLAQLATTIGRCSAAVVGLSEEALARPHDIQGYSLAGDAALFHTVEHMSYHTGQIVMLAKALGVALDFYPQHRGE